MKPFALKQNETRNSLARSVFLYLVTFLRYLCVPLSVVAQFEFTRAMIVTFEFELVLVSPRFFIVTATYYYQTSDKVSLPKQSI